MFFITINARAEWLCKEAASMLQENTFYACGHGISTSLSDARGKAFEAAKREFKNFCDESANCKDQAYNISPLRTDCSEKDGIINCHRGLEYTILPQKRSSIIVDKKEISALIEKKQKELSEMRSQIQKVNQLEEINSEIEVIKKLDTKEAEVEYLKHAKSDYSARSKQAISILMSYFGTSLPKDNSKNSKSVGLVGIGAAYEYKLVSFMSIKGRISYLFSGYKKTSLDDRGPADTNSKEDFHSHTGTDMSLGLPVFIKDFAISPTIGQVSVRYTSTQYEYNGFGVGTSKIEDKRKYSSTYVSLGLRYGKVFFIEVEPRQYFKDSEFKMAGSAGMRLEF